mgnify:CR=1 FL=1
MITYDLNDLLHIMQRLRAECPWDKAQTPLSLTRYAIEEAYEVEAAIRDGHTDAIKDELGDLLLQVVFQSQMLSEAQTIQSQGLQGQPFAFADVVQQLSEKMVRRHPHVFGENKLQQAQQVQGKPTMIVAHTLKGKGHTALENRAESHYLRVADAQAREALMDIMRVDGFEWPPR